MVFNDERNGIKAMIRFGKNQDNVNNFEGFIVNHTFKQEKFDVDKEIEFSKKFFKEKKKQNVLGKITGNWLEHIKFDGNIYWNINEHIPSWIRPAESVLPSDGRFREDLTWLFRSFNANNEEDKKKYEDNSQNWKHLIETMQRKDRETRKKK